MSDIHPSSSPERESNSYASSGSSSFVWVNWHSGGVWKYFYLEAIDQRRVLIGV